MKKFFAIFVLVLCASSILAQTNFNQGKIKQKSYMQVIPYQKVKGTLIVIPVIISGKAYKFILDTGASLYISYKLSKELNLQIIGKTGVNDASGTEKEMDLILLPELNLQGITFVNTPGIIEQEGAFLLNCLGVDGLIGSNMLRNSVVQFNDQSGHIIITNDIKKLSVKNTVKQKMELTQIQSNPYIVIGLKKGGAKASNKVLFDTGAANFYKMAISVYDWVNGRADIFDKIAEGEGSFSLGAHGAFEKQRHLLLNSPEIIVAETSFSNVVITTTNSSRSRIGSKLLQYGITTLDYKKKHFYFKPFDNINTKELSERPWSISTTISNNKMIVGVIWDKTLESQINLGDEILSVNGFDYQQMDTCELLNFDNIFSDELMVLVELRDIKTGEIKKVEIKRM